MSLIIDLIIIAAAVAIIFPALLVMYLITFILDLICRLPVLPLSPA